MNDMHVGDWINLAIAFFTAVAAGAATLSVRATNRSIRYSTRPILVITPQKFNLAFIHNPEFTIHNHGNGPAIVMKISAHGFVQHGDEKNGLGVSNILHGQPSYWHEKVVDVPVKQDVIPVGERVTYQLRETFEAFFGQKDGTKFLVEYADFNGTTYRNSCVWKDGQWKRANR